MGKRGYKQNPNVWLVLQGVIFCIALAGCSATPKEFAEPTGHIIACITTSYGYEYGYIAISELEKYTKKQIDTVTILYPYKDIHQGQFVVLERRDIRRISIGEYKKSFERKGANGEEKEGTQPQTNNSRCAANSVEP